MDTKRASDDVLQLLMQQLKENSKQFDLVHSRLDTQDKTIESLRLELESQKQVIERLEAENKTLRRNVAAAASAPDQDLAVVPHVEAPNKKFQRFMTVEQARHHRKEVDLQLTKQEILKRIWCVIYDLEDIGDANAQVWQVLEAYMDIVQAMQPESSSWGLVDWWYSAEGIITFEALHKAVEKDLAGLNLELEAADKVPSSSKVLSKRGVLQRVGAAIKAAEAQQEKEKADLEKNQWNILSNAPLQSPIQAVKEHLLSELNNAGVGLCKELQLLIEKLDEKDPVQFLIDQCVVYVQGNKQLEDSLQFVDDPAQLSPEQQERLRQFVETFVIGDDWVHVPEDGESIKEPNLFSATCSKVRRACSVYGYHESLDAAIDAAEEYKGTASKVKRTIDWIYFGGRLVVDPYGAAFSLLW